MKFNHFVYLYLGPDLDPAIHRSEIKTPKLTFSAIGMSFHEKERAIAIAKEAAAQGAQMIELCGGFGPIWIAKITEALEGKIPVGSVAYGPECRKMLVDLLS
jgi:hypothetical protein